MPIQCCTVTAAPWSWSVLSDVPVAPWRAPVTPSRAYAVPVDDVQPLCSLCSVLREFRVPAAKPRSSTLQYWQTTPTTSYWLLHTVQLHAGMGAFGRGHHLTRVFALVIASCGGHYSVASTIYACTTSGLGFTSVPFRNAKEPPGVHCAIIILPCSINLLQGGNKFSGLRAGRILYTAVQCRCGTMTPSRSP